MAEIASRDGFYMYNLYHITKAFYPGEDISQKVDASQEYLVKLTLRGGACLCIPQDEAVKGCGRQEGKNRVTRLAYDWLSRVSGKRLAWGTLTGVRPTKLIMQKIESGMGDEEIARFLAQKFDVSERKARLGIEIAHSEKRQLDRLDGGDAYSLYIGIPFCPSICSYCSFSSSPLAPWKERIGDYLDALCRELAAIAEGMRGRALNTVYIGGGTPTTLSADQLKRLLGLLEREFSYENLKEFTVEAGRPDTITEEKLKALSGHFVTRISINPQTMIQRTLDAVGRRHTVKEVRDAFYMAKSLGFDNINMDLIAGLPGETHEDMRETCAKIEELSPDELTVHSLAIKRAAKMGQEHMAAQCGAEIEKMAEEGAASAKRMGMSPYYLYRQKNIAGNFENVGYAKVDKAGIYNILIMEEKQTIVGAGAGAVTKKVLPARVRMPNGKEGNLIRTQNVKNVAEYIGRIDEMINRKGELLWR